MKGAIESPQPTNEDNGHSPPQVQVVQVRDSQGQITLRADGASSPFPDDIDINMISPEDKCEGADWFALFNRNVKRMLDVNLFHTLVHDGVILCVKFSADGKYLATGCDADVQIYDVKTGVKICVLPGGLLSPLSDLYYIRSVCFSPDGKYLAAGGEDKHVCVWEIATQRVRYVFDGHHQDVYSVVFSFDGQFIVSGSMDTTTRIWNMLDGTCKVLTNDSSGVVSVAMSPDGRYVAAGCLDFLVWIWDASSGELVERLRGHQDVVYSVAFTPDGKGLISGSMDKTLKYWDISGLGLDPSSGLPVDCPSDRNFEGHQGHILSVAVSPDGQWVVSGERSGVQFWDARNGVVQCMLKGHKTAVISVDFSPVGNYLATGGDGQARIWSYRNMDE